MHSRIGCWRRTAARSIPFGILAEPVLSPSDLASWDEQGYVVVRQTVSGEQCQAGLAAVLDHAPIAVDHPDSWHKDGIWISRVRSPFSSAQITSHFHIATFSTGIFLHRQFGPTFE